MSTPGSSREGSPAVSLPRASRSSRRKEAQTPQHKIDEFWDKYKTKAPGKATSILPQNEYAERAARRRVAAKSKAPAKTTEQSYEAAAEQCRRKVAQIVAECRRVNQRYRDPHFDLELDQKLNRRDCLESLDNDRCDGHGPRHGGRHARAARRRQLPKKDRAEDRGDLPSSGAAAAAGVGVGGGSGGGGGTSVPGWLGMVEKERAPHPRVDADWDTDFHPGAVKRVVDIFDNPQFYLGGPTANDVRQGRDGDCWLMAALCTLSNKPGLIERCCVAHDQAVGVYGFVFHRDGEWFSEIIDDKLYLTKPDFDESYVERILWEDRERVNSEEAYRKAYQSNSGSLYFAQCVNPNGTWLPLLEKAYAKAHGDYAAIEGGYGGEGIEDLTGGVTSEIYTTDILDKEHFWKEELMKVNQDFLFGCSTGVWGRGWGERKGIVELHAYSILRAREIDGVRLVLLKNPWGKHEWKGPWSDGSKEWTAEWLQKLDHKFGDDGSFWISYDDLLRKYQAFDRTRLFGPEWKVASIWTTLDISWTLDYHDTKFAFSLSQSGPVVIVFSQLDERYFQGLEGQYRFELSFRVHQVATAEGAGKTTTNNQADAYVVRSQNNYRMNRSVNVELDLGAGEYVVVVKVDAQRNECLMPVEEVVRTHAKERREKLLRIGQAYDLAHAKGKIVETAAEKAAREAFETRRRERDRRRMARCIKEGRVAQKKAVLHAKIKERKSREKGEAKAKVRAEKKAARRAARAEAEANAEGGKNAENNGMSKATGTEDGPKTPDANATAKSSDDEKIQVSQPDGGDSEEDGEHTPTSSTISSTKSLEGRAEEPQEDEAYVTAAEDATDKSDPGAGTPSTPSPPAPPLPRANAVDVGVQTGPGLPLHPPAPHRRDPPLPPMPPPRRRRRAPPRDLGHVPPHLRHAYAAGYMAAPGASGTELTSDTSDSALDELDAADDVSDVSEQDIDAYERRARAAAAKAMAAAGGPGGGGRAVVVGIVEEPLDEFEKDPWNAVGVFGLRVYYRVPAETAGRPGREEGEEEEVVVVRLRVERPNPHVWDESSDDDRNDDGGGDGGDGDADDGQADDEREEQKPESQVLDVDDSAKDAVGETPPAPGVEALREMTAAGGGGVGSVSRSKH